MSGKRRLSSVQVSAGLVEVEADEFEGTNLSPFGALGRRKSSLGGLTGKSPVKGSREFAKQEELAEKYRMIIKLSSENKINVKNSWNLDLIDNMGEMILNDAGHRGVNFQKASCTIDASVKIYSHRVDDTWTSSLRILENLSRNATDYDDEDDGEQVEEGVTDKPSAKVGSKVTSRRLDLLKTIEKNPAKINADKIENQQAVDPMFHKMSKAFDEGGAKGMLMANLRVAPSSSCIVFNATELAADKPTEPPAAATVDMQYLLSNTGFSLVDLLSVPICPVLDDYRATIGVKPSTAGVVAHTAESVSALCYRAPVFSFDEVASMGDAPVAYDDGDDDNYMPPQFADDMDEAAEYIPRSSLPPQEPPRRSSAAAQSKFNWNAVFGEESAASADAPASAPVRQEELLQFDVNGAGVTSAENFAFYSMSAAGNDWAGARHWKFGLRARAPKVTVAEAPVEAPVRAKKTKKEKAPLEFSAEPVDESVFGGDKAATTLTAAAVKKSAEQGRRKAFNLPPDAKLEPKDLCRLFLCPRTIVMPAMLSSMLQPKKQGKSSAPYFSREEDIIWGSAVQKVSQLSGNRFSLGEDAYESHHAGGEYVYEDDDDNYGGGNGGDDDDMPAAQEEDAPRTGLQIRLTGMAQAARKVEKIDIGYATSAKRVNVGKLKKDLWGNLDEKILAPEKKLSLAADSTVSFQEVISDVASQQVQQADITVSFYFICLLHLANEKNLVIKGCEAMNDLSIGKDV